MPVALLDALDRDDWVDCEERPTVPDDLEVPVLVIACPLRESYVLPLLSTILVRDEVPELLLLLLTPTELLMEVELLSETLLLPEVVLLPDVAYVLDDRPDAVPIVEAVLLAELLPERLCVRLL